MASMGTVRKHTHTHKNRTDLSKKEETTVLYISFVTGDEREDGVKEDCAKIP